MRNRRGDWVYGFFQGMPAKGGNKRKFSSRQTPIRPGDLFVAFSFAEQRTSFLVFRPYTLVRFKGRPELRDGMTISGRCPPAAIGPQILPGGVLCEK